jgi:EmrB/QacA subfamily drug resistance transporter
MVSTLTVPQSPVGWRRHPSVILAVILTAQLMVVLDATIVNVALPHIQRSLHFSNSSLSWVLNAYVLTFGGLLLLGARSGDLLGRRRTFMAGIALFSLSSLAGGFATTSVMLLAARALQGVGGALAAPAALALLTTFFPEGAARVKAIGLFTTVSAAGGALGLVAGGLLTEWTSWRWVMFVNVPIGLIVLFVGRAVLVETPRRHGRFDVAGAITSTVGMSAIVFGLVEAGSDGWAAPVTFVSLVAGGALLWLFVRIEKTAPEPILPLRILTDRTRASANVARGLGYAGMYGMIFFLTQFLQDIQRHSSLITGIGFLPAPTSVFLSSQLTARVLVNRLPAKVIMIIGMMCLLLGLLLATQLHADTPYAQVLVGLILMGAGTGISFVSLTSAGLAGVAPSDAGAASGLVNVMQQVGAALGLAVLVTIFDTVTPSARSAGLSTAARAGTAARTALVHGIDVTMAAGAGLALLALAIVVFLIRTPARAQVMEPVEIELESAAA